MSCLALSLRQLRFSGSSFCHHWFVSRAAADWNATGERDTGMRVCGKTLAGVQMDRRLIAIFGLIELYCITESVLSCLSSELMTNEGMCSRWFHETSLRRH